MVEPSRRQLKFQEPRSSRHKGWDSFAQTQTSVISSGAVKNLSWPVEGTSESRVFSRVYLPSLADVTDSSPCLDVLLDNLTGCSWAEGLNWGISESFFQHKWYCGLSWKKIPVHWAPESSALLKSTDSYSAWFVWGCLGVLYPMRCSSPLWDRTALMGKMHHFMPGQEWHLTISGTWGTNISVTDFSVAILCSQESRWQNLPIQN